MRKTTTVCVYAGGRGNGFATYEAFEVGQVLGNSGVFTIFGGGKNGSMGALANGVLSSGSSAIIGNMPSYLNTVEIRHPGVEVNECKSLSERKDWMFERANAFLALPGGVGTADEIFDCLCRLKLAQGSEGKRLAVLNTNGAFDYLFFWLKEMVADGFLTDERLNLVYELTSFEELRRWIEKVKGE